VAGLAAAVMLLVVGPALTACAGAQVGAHAGPAAAAEAKSSPSPTSLSDSLTPAQLLALAQPPSGAAGASAPQGAIALPAAGVCGLTSTGTAYWSAPTMTETSAATWLYAHPPHGMKKVTYVNSAASSLVVTGYVLDAVSESSTEGLLFSVIFNDGDGVMIRVDAVTLPRGAACLARNAAKQQAAPTFPVADPGGKVDAASQQKADGWLAGAVVPPGAVTARTRPTGVAKRSGTDMWCEPMADAVGYWTLPGMSADDTMAWLGSHPSLGMTVTGGSGNPRSGGETNAGGVVVNEPAPMSLEALIFTVTPIGSGSGIRADAFAKAANSVCATAPPGTALGIGG